MHLYHTFTECIIWGPLSTYSGLIMLIILKEYLYCLCHYQEFHAFFIRISMCFELELHGYYTSHLKFYNSCYHLKHMR